MGSAPSAKSALEDLYADRQDNVKSMQAVRATLGVSRFIAYGSDEDGEHCGSDTDDADAGAMMSAPDAAGAGNQVMTSPSHASWVHPAATIMTDRTAGAVAHDEQHDGCGRCRPG